MAIPKGAGSVRDKLEHELRRKQSEFFDSFFRKGAEFTRELLEENERLRGELAELERKLAGAADARAAELHERFAEIERENNDLAALYVAQSQLHSTLDAAEIVDIISEILLNFIGASAFAIFMRNRDGGLSILTSQGVEEGIKLARHKAVEGALSTGEPAIAGIEARDPSGEPAVVVPLVAEGVSFAAVAIWRFLPHKEELAAVDRQLFELVGQSGGLALKAARVASQLQSGAGEPQDDVFEVYRTLLN